LVSEAENTTLGEEIIVRGPHFVVTLTEYKGHYWLTNARMVRYQSMLCESPQEKLELVQTLNPVTLLPSAAGPPDHDCVEVINEFFSSCPDLGDKHLSQLDLNYSQTGAPPLKKEQDMQFIQSYLWIQSWNLGL
jgi:hypothetical protein